ncbi:MAG: zinc ribbon domain-containing protein [Candidatus Wallbacteria bacterium]
MPIFEFKCAKCEKTFEKIQSSKAPNPDCPECGHNKTEKLISVFGFKGTGEGAKSSASLDGCGSCSTHNCGSCGCH